jgi:pyruvate,water dikinase
MSGRIVPIDEAADEQRYGGKAVQLGAARRAGLPVPPGVALDWEVVHAIAAGDNSARDRCRAAYRDAGAAIVAVRSSAVGEDSATASFAGQHLTKLGMTSPEAVIAAIVEAFASARSSGAMAYREKLGIAADAKLGIVVQQLVDADCAGVMFTRDPLTGADVRIIEAAWGLGEAVVSGLVDPDRYRVERGGAVAATAIGEKHAAIRLRPDGDTEETAVAPSRQAAACLDTAQLLQLDALATACDRVFGGDGGHDIEWAFERSALYLLQRRPITR